MVWLELKIENIAQEQQEILVSRLDELGFESFLQEENELFAYARGANIDENKVKRYLDELHFRFHLQEIEEINWNAEWEKSYEPVMIGEECIIRASFHDPVPGFRYDLLIEPRMSFGTAHHETTRLMIEAMLRMDFSGKKVLDMGCGTGILAILAAKMGARQVVAVDNDEWAFRNALDNIAMNKTKAVQVMMGDIDVVHSKDFNVILSNINRNILLKHLCAYYNFLRKGGVMILSGFYSGDSGAIRNQAESFGFSFQGSSEINDWQTLAFRK